MSKIREILERKNNRRTRLQASLDSIVSQIREIGALRVILFGSLVEEEVDVYSDLDLLVIMPSTRTGKEWTDMIYRDVERGVSTDIIVYNQREFEEKLPTSSFLRSVLDSGRVVYEKTS